MTPARAPLLLLMATVLLAVAACQTLKKPIHGFDEQPPGSIVFDDVPGGTVMMWPVFDLPQTQQIFRPRVDGQYVAYAYDNGFYEYLEWPLQGWTGGWSSWLQNLKPGTTYVVDLVDGAGRSWGQSAPLSVTATGTPTDPLGQPLAVVFAHFDDKVASWTIDPTTQDADTATDEITVTNLIDADVVVERCLISSGQPSSCTPVGTVAPGADLFTVERLVADVSSKDDHQALVIHLASDADQSYRRDLLQGSGGFQLFVSTCQVERIFVHGPRPTFYYSGSGSPGIAMSSCYGNTSGPM